MKTEHHWGEPTPESKLGESACGSNDVMPHDIKYRHTVSMPGYEAVMATKSLGLNATHLGQT